MAMTLRPYQAEARDAVLHEWEQGRKRTLLVLPTGCGKTVVFSKVAEDRVNRGGRVLVMAHRGELLDQAADKIRQVTGIECAYEKASASALGSILPITVGSVQSLCQERRLSRFPRDYYSSIIVDEAHHCLSDSYQRVLAYFSEADVLGVTATADRADKRNLGTFFDSQAYEYTMTQAIREGYLCPIKAQMIPLQLDISEVGVSNGDYNVGEIGNALEPYLRQIAGAVALPCLRKDFTVDEYMLYEAKALGAAAALLICAILDEVQIRDYIQICDALGLDALVEAHDEAEAEAALRSGARILGVNNRNLKDFSVDTENSRRLRSLIPPEILFVSESGVRTAGDAAVLREIGADAVLIGEALMRSKDKRQMLKQLKGET